MDPQALGRILPPVNAALNLTATGFLVAGLVFIRRREIRRHRAAMIGAVAASALFLVLYVIRFSLTGTHRFAGEGAARVVYLAVLFSHMVLATLIVPLVLRLLYLVKEARYRAHARLARWTYPAWLYVSITGVAVYLMLYRIYGFE